MAGVFGPRAELYRKALKMLLSERQVERIGGRQGSKMGPAELEDILNHPGVKELKGDLKAINFDNPNFQGVSRVIAERDPKFRGKYSGSTISIDPQRFDEVRPYYTDKAGPILPHELYHHYQKKSMGLSSDALGKYRAKSFENIMEIEGGAEDFAHWVRKRAEGMPLDKIPEKYRDAIIGAFAIMEGTKDNE